MNALSNIAKTTMSSREIAELVESRHDVVKLSIVRLTGKGIIQPPPMVEVKNDQGQTVSEYQISKRDSYIIVAQLSPAFTARLVDRWQELENQASPTVPLTYAAALRVAADQAEQIERQQAELAAAAPKVEFVNRYVESTGNKGFRQVCKLLSANEAEFRKFLTAEKIMYSLNGEWTPYADHMNTGRFAVRTGTADSGHTFNNSKFTPKGVAWVAGRWDLYRVSGAPEA